MEKRQFQDNILKMSTVTFIILIFDFVLQIALFNIEKYDRPNKKHILMQYLERYVDHWCDSVT